MSNSFVWVDIPATDLDHGGRVLKDPHPIGPHGWRAVIEDSEGNRVALHSSVE